MHQICYHRAEHHADHREPVDRLADLHVLIFLLVQEVAKHQNDTHRRQGAVQDVQPAAEVPVQPDGEHCTDDAGDKHHGLLFLAEDVSKTEARRIERVVVRRPDVQAQDQDGEVEQAKVDHHLEDVVAAHVDRRDTAEEEHQRVADEERDHRCDGAHLAAFGKAGEVRRRRAAGDERANDQSRAADHRQRATGLGKLIDDRAVAAHDGEDHRDRTQYRHHRDGDIADDRERLDTEVGRGRHADTGNDHQRPLRRLAAAQQLIRDRDGKHGDAHAEPADLRERDHSRGQIRTLDAKRLAGQKVEAHARLRAHVAQKTCVQAQDHTADDHRHDEALKIQAVRQLLSHPHARGEKGEAQHDHKHGHDTASGAFRHDRLCVVNIHYRLFILHAFCPL